MLTRTIQDVAVVLLGLLAGAMLLIAVAFVGYWRSLEPEAFCAASRLGGAGVLRGQCPEEHCLRRTKRST